MLFVVFSGVLAALFVFGPRPGSAPSSSQAESSSVFDDTRSSAELQSRIAAQQAAGWDRGSALDSPGKRRAAMSAEIEARLREVELRLARTRAQLARGRRGGSTWSIVKKAEDAYFRLKNSKRFKDSKALKEFRKEFLSYPDLQKLNKDYYEKDGSTIKFIRDTLKSPNFGQVVKKHINQPDVHAFFTSMAGSADVMQAAKVMTKEYGLRAAIDKLTLPGLGSMGQLKKSGEQMKKSGGASADKAAEMLGIDPDMLDMGAVMRKAQGNAPPATTRERR